MWFRGCKTCVITISKRAQSIVSCQNLIDRRNALPMPLAHRKPRGHGDSSDHFVDYIRITTEGGRGGDGWFSFLSLPLTEFAGPDGGDGGNGGHVIFKANEKISSLNHLQESYKAPSGKIGKAKCCHGASGEHITVEVPLQTLFKRVGTEEVVFELKTDGEIFLAARGGQGGHGNHFYVTSTNRTPWKTETGAPGEVAEYEIEMRVIAHAGLVGRDVASYPFTTLRPHVGVVEFDDYAQLSIADIPGIIEDGHKNVGLGISFLKHIERCLCFVYVIDLTLPNPELQYDTLVNELELYKPGLTQRSRFVLANKCDLPASTAKVQKLRTHLKSYNLEDHLIPVSAKNGTGLFGFLLRLRKLIDEKSLERETYEFVNDS